MYLLLFMHIMQQSLAPNTNTFKPHALTSMQGDTYQ